MPSRSKAPSTSRKVRYGVVGLGHIAQVAVLPAFANARRNSELVALFSDDRVKLRELGARYQVKGRYDYDEYERCLSRGELDAVYIALPNNLHRDYSIRASRAGAHVLCEKPMALTEDDCSAMIRAAHESRTKLMVAYRLHFEKANLECVEALRSGRLGEPRLFSSVFTMQVKAGNIRLQGELGGGTLYDIGIYCINAARYLLRDEPEEVFAWSVKGRDERFRDVDEMTSAIMRFPHQRLASFTSSFGAADVSAYEVVGTKGRLRLDPAYEYSEDLEQTISVDGGTRTRTFKRRDQFGSELLYFSDCVLTDQEPEPSGEEGLADVRVIRALYRSAETGQPVRLSPFSRRVRPTLAQEIRRPAVKKPEVVHAGARVARQA